MPEAKTKGETERGVVPTVLDFLQEGADKNLSHNTLKVKVVTLSSFDIKLADNPLVKGFFYSIGKSKPIRNKKCPVWDLSMVLKGFLRVLKTILLGSLVSARRVSEIQALPTMEPYCSI